MGVFDGIALPLSPFGAQAFQQGRDYFGQKPAHQPALEGWMQGFTQPAAQGKVDPLSAVLGGYSNAPRGSVSSQPEQLGMPREWNPVQHTMTIQGGPGGAVNYDYGQQTPGGQYGLLGSSMAGGGVRPPSSPVDDILNGHQARINTLGYNVATSLLPTLMREQGNFAGAQMQTDAQRAALESQRSLAQMEMSNRGELAALERASREREGEANRRVELDKFNLNSKSNIRNGLLVQELAKSDPITAAAKVEAIMSQMPGGQTPSGGTPAAAPAATPIAGQPPISQVAKLIQQFNLGQADKNGNIAPLDRVRAEHILSTVANSGIGVDGVDELVRQLKESPHQVNPFHGDAMMIPLAQQLARDTLRLHGGVGSLGDSNPKIKGEGFELFRETPGFIDMVGNTINSGINMTDTFNRMRLPNGRVIELPSEARSGAWERLGMTETDKEEVIRRQATAGFMLKKLLGAQ